MGKQERIEAHMRWLSVLAYNHARLIEEIRRDDATLGDLRTIADVMAQAGPSDWMERALATPTHEVS